jgi:hypothetical protein
MLKMRKQVDRTDNFEVSHSFTTVAHVYTACGLYYRGMYRLDGKSRESMCLQGCLPTERLDERTTTGAIDDRKNTVS